MSTFIILLRGVNVGGRSLSMQKLREVCESFGLEHVSTYIQSGNIICMSDRNKEYIQEELGSAIEKEFGFPIPIMIRTKEELAKIIERNPYKHLAAKEPNKLVVMFLNSLPTEIKLLHEPEEVCIDNKNIYIYYPNGIGKSKLTNVFIEKKLSVSGTARNWNTVLKLMNMAEF